MNKPPFLNLLKQSVRWMFFPLALSCCLLTVSAQVATDDDDDVIELSPFIVDGTRDDGYRATNATSGTRLNVEIKNLPMSLEVITAEFITDTGATDLQESLSYSSGIALENFMQLGGSAGPGANAASIVGAEVSPSSSGVVGDRTTNAISIRGFTAPFQQRMGFRIGATIPHYGVTLGATIDAVSIERNEILRGPGAMLYGIGVISGIVNVIPKTPLSEQRQSVSFGMGSNDYMRATLDVTGPITQGRAGKLNYRVAAAFTEKGDWTDYFLDKRQYYTVQLQYELGRKLNLLLEFQDSTTRFEGLGQQYIYEDLGNANNKDYRNEWNETHNWASYYGGLGMEARITGPDTWYEREEQTYLLNLQFLPTSQLSFNTGVFFADQKSEHFTVNVNMFNNREGPVTVKSNLDEGLYFTQINPPNPLDSLEDTNDYKAIRYWWKKEPQAAKTLQTRMEMAYKTESPWIFSDHAKHDFLLGFQYIQDDIDFARGLELARDVYDITAKQYDKDGNSLPEAQWLSINEDGDAYFIRDFFDFSPFRYNGEPLARPGNQYSSSTLWYRGYYGVYHGRFFDEKLTVIAGYRRDLYQAYKEDWVRERYDPTNRRIGTESAFYNFEKTQQIDSTTWSLGYRLTDSLSIYGLIAGGVSPNTGQSDGNGVFFAPEETTSKEVGIKFDLLDGRISGTVSIYQITRENATWSWRNAPNPSIWSDSPFIERREDTHFNAGFAESGVHPRSYGVDYSYFNPEDIRDSITGDVWDPVRSRGDPVGVNGGILPGVENVGATTVNFVGIKQTVIYLDYDKLDESGFRETIEAAWADARTRAQPFDIDPIRYRYFPGGAGIGNSASANTSTGALVSFTDEATGFDFQIILKPVDNWQIVLSYAHTKRQAITGFNLVDAVDLNTGINYGTEYDIWVRDLGRENFEDPTRPSTATGGGVKGLSLSFVPVNTASIWSNYKIREGFFAGFEFGLGVVYQGSAQTSVPIGGRDLASNLYRTPDTKELYKVNSTITYKHAFEKFDLRVSLNIYNLLETNPYHESRIAYDNPNTGGQEMRRSFYYVDPRSFRLTVSLSF